MQDCPSRVGRLSSPVSYARDEDKATLSRQVFRHGMLEPIEVANHVLNQLVHRFRTDIVRKKTISKLDPSAEFGPISTRE